MAVWAPGFAVLFGIVSGLGIYTLTRYWGLERPRTWGASVAVSTALWAILVPNGIRFLLYTTVLPVTPPAFLIDAIGVLPPAVAVWYLSVQRARHRGSR